MEQRSNSTNLHERRFPQDGVSPRKAHPRSTPLHAEDSSRNSLMKLHVQTTSPETPMNSEDGRPQSANRALFHNYLRAFCRFEPPQHVDKDDKALLMTVHLDAGDLILVHSVHANGWADGTVLSSGARGWLPTNYCETFDHPSLRHLLNAMTQFWDLLGVDDNCNLSTFVRQDYVRPLIAGVRHLLEHADCLHRDSALVQRNAGLRRLRKGLLADLSTLVQIAKRLQEVIREPFAGEVIHLLLDDLMARAFKVVTRAVGFVDILAQEKTSANASVKLMSKTRGPKPRLVQSAVAQGTDALETDRPLIDSAKCFSQDSSELDSATIPPSDGANGQHGANRHAAKHPAGPISHRLSMVQNDYNQYKTLASEQLNQAHDLCISHIGSFIGLYLHSSRPATELASTTERLVSACRCLLDIVDKVSLYEPQPKTTVQQARKIFQVRLDDLIQSTKDLFVHSEQVEGDVVMLPEHSSRLVEVGTSLIRTVGDCVVKTRKVIEQIGNFDLEGSARNEEKERQEHEIPETVLSEAGQSNSLAQPKCASETDVVITVRPPRTPLAQGSTMDDIADDAVQPRSATPTAISADTPISPTSHHSLPLPNQPGNSPTRNVSKGSRTSTTRSATPNRQCSMGASISESTDTQPTSLRDSGSTAVSEGSTRATTPEHGKNAGDLDERLVHSFDSLASLRSAADTEDNVDAEAQLLQKSYANELTLNKEGQVTGGSLSALVEQLTLGDVAPDAQFVDAFFVTFRTFTTPRELAQALIYRFDYIGDSKSVGAPVRSRIYSFFKSWLESHWNAEADRVALGDIRYFALHKLKPTLPQASQRLFDLTQTIASKYQNGTMGSPITSSGGNMTRSVGAQKEVDSCAPEPSITKSQLNALRNAVAGGTAPCTVVDFDPLELARQMTLLAANIFCKIQADELLSLEWNKKDSTKAQNVRNMCILNTDVAHVVGDTVLTPEDAKKRALVIKHWSKVAMKCLELSNYESLTAILCSLNSSVVQRLKRTWEVVSKKTKARLAELNAIVDFSRNQASLRKRLETPSAPCLPFLGIYLTDLTMVDAGNPKLRELPGSTSESGETLSVINFDKHMRMAKIVNHVQKFQVPYKLKEVPELQEWMHMHLERMREGHAQMVGVFHRRSLVIEPKVDLSNAPRMPEIRRTSEPSVPDEQPAIERPKTASASVHPTVRTFKPYGQTFEFFRANFNFKSRQEIAVPPDDMGQE